MMESRSMIIGMVLVTVLACWGSVATAQTPAGSPQAVQADDGEDRIVVYYFHGTRRCKTCRSIEEYARKAVESGFSGQIDSGVLSMKAVNFDEQENEHFLDDFELVGSSLVLVELEKGRVVRHKVLQEVWTLVRDKQEFIQYVQREIGGYIGRQH